MSPPTKRNGPRGGGPVALHTTQKNYSDKHITALRHLTLSWGPPRPDSEATAMRREQTAPRALREIHDGIRFGGLPPRAGLSPSPSSSALASLRGASRTFAI